MQSPFTALPLLTYTADTFHIFPVLLTAFSSVTCVQGLVLDPQKPDRVRFISIPWTRTTLEQKEQVKRIVSEVAYNMALLISRDQCDFVGRGDDQNWEFPIWCRGELHDFITSLEDQQALLDGKDISVKALEHWVAEELGVQPFVSQIA